MKATITDVDQRFSLAARSFTNYLTFELPSGKRFQVPVDEGVVEAIINESTGVPSEPELPAISPSEISRYTPETGPAPQLHTKTVEPTDSTLSEPLINWMELPESECPQEVKEILTDSGVDGTLSAGDFYRLRARVLEKLASAPKVGEVAWNARRQRSSSVPARRVVPADDWGNPIPPGGITEPDPGEVSGGEDEDGVQQA